MQKCLCNHLSVEGTINYQLYSNNAVTVQSIKAGT